MLSLSDLRYANFTSILPSTIRKNGGGYNISARGGTHLYPLRLIGSDRPNFRLGSDSTKEEYENSSVHELIHGLNKKLFNNYYFSGRKIATDLPVNSRYVSFYENGKNDALVVSGAFNINSTSVDAWISVLSGLKEKGVSSFITPANTVPFSAFNQPELGAYEIDMSESSPEVFKGYRVLTESEIQQLASSIVTVVKEIGPFESVASFINRSLSSNDRYPVTANFPIQKMSPLEIAIAQSGINKNLIDKYNEIGISEYSSSYPDRESASGSTIKGVNGWLSQADILYKIDSFLTVRSDTFRVFVAGKGMDGNARELEMLIQRTPDYLIAADDEYLTSAKNLQNQINRNFGRRLKIIYIKQR